jgi:hypothetical protein
MSLNVLCQFGASLGRDVLARLCACTTGVLRGNPHVHLAVRAEDRDGKRISPRKHDLRHWREMLAERLRGLGIEAEATSKVARGSRHRNERLWQRKAYDGVRGRDRGGRTDAKLTLARFQAAQAWLEIAKALSTSDDIADRERGQSVVNYMRWLPGVRVKPPERQPKRAFPGMSKTLDRAPERTRSGPELER